MVRFEQIADALRERVLSGHYETLKFPSERDLALEFAASYLTARKAVQYLIQQGLLTRTARGRATPATADARSRIALLTHDWPSLWGLRLREAVGKAVSTAGLAFSTHHYLHWDDPCIADTLHLAAGVVFVPLSDAPPPRVLASLLDGPARVLALRGNLFQYGLQTFDRLPPAAVTMALDHFAACGHRRITVFNVQPDDAIIKLRHDEARNWARHHPDVALGFAGEAVASGQHALPAARIQARVLLANRRPDAVLALTLPAAQGMLRAIADFDAGAGDRNRIAVAAIDGEDLADHLIPSITSVDPDPRDLDRILGEAITWMRTGEWPGDPSCAYRPVLHIRESSQRP